MDTCEVISHSFRGEDMIPVLPTCKIVAREVGAREDDLVISAIEFDML